MAVGPTAPRNTTSGKGAAKSTPSLTGRVRDSLNSFKNLVKIAADALETSPVIGGGAGTIVKKDKKDTKGFNDVPRGSWVTKQSGKRTPDGVDFNLPPHQWSLPLNPSIIDKGSNVTAPHAQRRGKMWLFAEVLQGEAKDTTKQITDSNTKNEGGKSVPGERDSGQRLIDRSVLLSENAALGNSEQSQLYAQAAKNYKPAGFQFLWNPDSISVSVSTVTDIVPDAGDRLRSVIGAFPSMEYVTFSVLIDRTYDFACVYRDFHTNKQDITKVANDKYKTYYSGNGLNQDPGSFPNKLQELMTYGTMHDVEYVFKMLNAGTIFANIQPTNPLGRKTYDLGYLYPALVAIEFGPYIGTTNPLSYVGWTRSVSIKHLAFNTNMIPLRTELSFDVQIYTGFGQLNSGE